MVPPSTPERLLFGRDLYACHSARRSTAIRRSDRHTDSRRPLLSL